MQALDIDTIISFALASILFLVLVGSVYMRIQQIRRRRIRKLEKLLVNNMTLSVSELASQLDTKPIPIQSVLYAAQNAENAILSFSKTSVVSSTLLIRRLKNLLIDNSVIHVVKESTMWDVPERVIEDYVEMISEKEGLDVVQTEDGDFILVPEFKERMREVLGLQGRINITSEAQRLRVKRFDLVKLVERWGWNLIEMGDGFLVSSDWLKKTLERSMERTGYLEPSKEASRLSVSERDILEAMRRFGWSTITTTDNRLLPVHAIADRLESLLELEGYLNPVEEAKKLHIDQDELMKIVRRTGMKFFVDDDGIIVTFEYLKNRVLDDLALSGKIEVNEEADTLGVKVSVITTILRNAEKVRKIGRGKYISTTRLRQWILDSFSEDGILNVDSVEMEWGITNPSLNLILKEFGIRTVATRDGNHLSLSWIRTKIMGSLEDGKSVDPLDLVDELNISFGIAQALLAQIDAEAIMNTMGALVPVSKLQREFSKIYNSKGVLDPSKEARERMLDPSDVIQIIKGMDLDALIGKNDTFISVGTIFRLVRWALKNNGIYDLRVAANRLNVNYSELTERISPLLRESDFLIKKAGVIVTDDWVSKLRKKAKSLGRINVTTFSKEQSIRRGAMIELLRKFLQGAYIPRSDVYMVRS
ncbi:MAG: hypothetical protein GF411_14965 [Candidatus Lokiarchaeota archaeon]|nr:hypothetical protein [Candidatus Lokiarchaeota archaeon]